MAIEISIEILLIFFCRLERKDVMSELLFFVLGIIIGGLVMTTLMCCLQINRINEMEARCLKLEKANSEEQDEN